MSRLARLAWVTLVVNILVILWGAFVRASGSGAGCGAHWPLCNGEVVPRAAGLATIIELTHRLTSGVALLLAALVCVRAFRDAAATARTKRAAAVSMVFMLTEAGVGAGLVLFELVADNASMARALFMSVHLVNTFFLLASLTLTAYFASGGPRVSLGSRPALSGSLLASLGLLVLTGVSGAIAALGDTLYPARSLADALAQELSPTSHLLIRLRLLHPALAILSGLVLIGTVRFAARRLPNRLPAHYAQALEGLVAIQWVGGFVNVVLLAPVWMQIAHLLVADTVWMMAIVCVAQLLRAETAPAWSPAFEGAAHQVASSAASPRGG